MKLGAQRRRARSEESEDETESEKEESEDESGAEIEEEEEETEAQDTEESSPTTAPKQGTAEAARDARIALLEEGQAALRQDISNLRGLVKDKFNKVTWALKTIMCCLKDKGAPSPSPNSDA
jgi:TATA-binding protein-associated factor Taf7